MIHLPPMVIPALLLASVHAASAQEGIDDILSVVDACDVLAAHPEDPMRVAPGVPDAELVPRLAIQACETALAGSRDIARHAFQLGRGYLGLDNREAALAFFGQAAEAGSSIALVYLGDAEQFGWVDTPDPDRALEFYHLARSAGFANAAFAIDQITLDPALFTAGSMLEVLAEGRIDIATEFAQSDLARAYLYAFYVELSQRCGAFLEPAAVPALQYYRFPPGWNAASEEGQHELGVQDVMATYDVEVLVDRHGCTGHVIETIAQSFNAMVMALAEQ
ncbi:hypothetical protein [Fluviibacterium sp. S390]|uniref:hypothetical protein n=1 Tax=Fluviibacterium sp. S390 TaxID=3415139 RepID=UPI003C7D965A